MCNQWIETVYPELTELFYFHSFQGMKLPIWAIVKAKKSGGLKANILDFQFNKNNGKYFGLFIELKKETPYLKNGNLKEHGINKKYFYNEKLKMWKEMDEESL